MKGVYETSISLLKSSVNRYTRAHVRSSLFPNPIVPVLECTHMMGNNQSKVSEIPDILLRSRTQREGAPTLTRIRIDSLVYSTTTSERELQVSREARQNRPWLPQLLEHGRPADFTPDMNFIANSALMVSLIGNIFFPELADESLSAESCAAMVMWLLEERAKKPWATLWLFLNTRCNLMWPHTPRFPVGAVLMDKDILVIQMQVMARELAERIRKTFVDYRFVCEGCGRMVKDNECFRSCSCKQVYYCSKECQCLNWPQHRLECTAIPSEPI